MAERPPHSHNADHTADHTTETSMAVSGAGPYDPNNIFARILRDEIPSRRVYEDEWAIAFHDISPLAPVHILVIPRGPYVSISDFVAKATDAEIAGFFRAVGQVAKQEGLESPGFRLLTNMGMHSGQEVPHLHVHLFGGAPLGPMLDRRPKA
jgi:diadenosine tetraphosphate (Ap4A) HIT family hydrolase